MDSRRPFSTGFVHETCPYGQNVLSFYFFGPLNPAHNAGTASGSVPHLIKA